MSLSDFSPSRYRQFVWNYSWDDLKKFYIQKNKETSERIQAFCEFLVELTSAAFGGGKKEDEITLDTGEGLDDLTDEQIAEMKIMLGDDFAKVYPDLVDD